MKTALRLSDVTLTTYLGSPEQLHEHLSRLTPEEALVFLANLVRQSKVSLWRYIVFFGLRRLMVLPVLGGSALARNELSEQVLRQVREARLIERLSGAAAALPLLELIDAVSWPQDTLLRHWWWRAIYPVLVHGLPLLSGNDFGTNHRRALQKLLHVRGNYEELQVAVLLALGTVGVPDWHSEKEIRWLLRHSPSERVREAALEYLLAFGKTA